MGTSLLNLYAIPQLAERPNDEQVSPPDEPEKQKVDPVQQLNNP